MKCNVLNRTIFNRDNLDILRNINSNCIDLIYLDPPFNKKKIFDAPIGSSAEGASFDDKWGRKDIKDEWVKTIEGEHTELFNILKSLEFHESHYCYLCYMAIRLVECHRILKDTGSIYLHCDTTMSHYLKLIMDCIFGMKNFRNEIVWDYKKISNTKGKKFNRRHDYILFYSKSNDYTFNHQYTEISERKKELIKAGYNTKNMNGIKYIYIYDEDIVKKKKIKLSKYDKIVTVDSTKGTLQSDIFNINNTNSQDKQYVGYPTQKPIILLEKIIITSSNEGDIVLDPFCGCATTCIAAEKLNRKWIGIDISVMAYDLVRQRLKKEVKQNLNDWGKKVNYTTKAPKYDDIGKKESGYVYIIANPLFKGKYKIGIASDPKKRLNSYQTSDPSRNFKLVYSKKTPKYKEIEKHIIKNYESKYEWVKGKLEKIIKDIENFYIL